ncbi:MAG: hypothetical protein IJN30_02795 [Bacteroidales bacterium]|nr:hypothetical protein [Bacteroidales bacterium]
MNTNSNTYTVIYSIILVVIVAAVLAFAATFLKPTQEANVKKDTIGQILTAAAVRATTYLKHTRRKSNLQSSLTSRETR